MNDEWKTTVSSVDHEGTRLAQQHKLFAALVKAQAEMPHPLADKTATVTTKKGGQFSYKFAPLNDVIDKTKPILQRHGLAIYQSVGGGGGEISVTTTILHQEGGCLSDTVSIKPEPDGRTSYVQQAGIAITYLRRYGWSAACGVYADKDTDGGTGSVPGGEDEGFEF